MDKYSTPILIKKIIRLPFLKFLFVGGINTAFGYLLYSIIVYLIANPYISMVAATIISILFNFKTYSAIVFKSKGNSKILHFFAIYLLVMVVQILLFKELDYLGINNPYLAGAVITLPTALLSFFLMKKFVFRQHE